MREAFSPAGLGRRTQDFMTWIDTLRQAGRLSSGALLGASPERLSLDLKGRIPGLPELRGAAIRLFFLIEAADMSAALEIAEDCPSALPGTIDVYHLETQVDASPPIGRRVQLE